MNNASLDINNFSSFKSDDIKNNTLRLSIAITWVKYLSGAIGLIALYPFGLAANIFLYRRLRRVRIKLDTTLQVLYSRIPNNTERDNINNHLSIERLKEEIIGTAADVDAYLVDIYNKSILKFLINRMRTENARIKDSIIDAESKLKNAAYPEFQRKELTQDQLQELKNIYNKSNIDFSDWEDDSMDLYEKKYL